MAEDNHKTDDADCDSDESTKSDSAAHSYYYDDATGYEIFQDDGDDEAEEDCLPETDRPS